MTCTSVHKDGRLVESAPCHKYFRPSALSDFGMPAGRQEAIPARSADLTHASVKHCELFTFMLEVTKISC